MHRSMHYFMIMQENKAIKKRNKRIGNLFLREVSVQMRAFSYCNLIEQSWLLFLVQYALVEGYTSKQCRMLDFVIDRSLSRGVEIAIECAGFFMHEEYFLRVIFDESEGVSIEFLHLFLLIIFSLIIGWFTQTRQHEKDSTKDLLAYKTMLLEVLYNIICLISL